MDHRREGPALAAEYATRLSARKATVERLERRHQRFGNTRLALFASAVVIALGWGWAGVPWLVVPAAAFGALAFAHARVLNTRDHAARAVAHYERAIARLEDRWAGLGDPGDRFRDDAHPYADDLDLFGRGSLFDLLSTPRTAAGEATLARWLLGPADVREVALRQQAVRDLAPRVDLREHLAVVGPDVRRAIHTDALLAWAAAPKLLTARWPAFVLPVLAAASTAALAAWAWTGAPPVMLLPLLAAQGLLGWWFRARVLAVAGDVDRRERELEVLGTLIERLEQEEASSPRLSAIRARLTSTGHQPSQEIRRLARLVELLTSRQNQFFAPVAALWMMATQLAFAVDRWRARCGHAVPLWLEAVGEYEALVALATYAAERDDAVFPEVVDGAPRLSATRLFHPLLPRASAVANDVDLGGHAPPLMLISGSNMAGKSTFLRTIGLAAVMAQAGAPVPAGRCSMTPLMVGATLRIQDSLQAGRSRFYAEITRMAQVVTLARRGPTLFLLDEMLSGTNSHDRQQGAEAILGGLLDLGAIGAVTTHDLALAAIADRLAPRARNTHFEDRFEDGVLHFDYTLKPGVVRSSNAIALMRSVGLDV